MRAYLSILYSHRPLPPHLAKFWKAWRDAILRALQTKLEREMDKKAALCTWAIALVCIPLLLRLFFFLLSFFLSFFFQHAFTRYGFKCIGHM